MPYSSKIEGVTEERFEKALKLASFLMLQNIHIISPVLQGHVIVKKYKVPSDWAYWEEYCVKVMSACDSILIFKLSGWQESSGVKGENEEARKLKLPIYFIDEENRITKL